MNGICKLVLAAGLAIGTASSATAATFTYLASGTFTSDFGDGFAQSDIALGDTFVAAAVYESTATPFNGTPTRAQYFPTKVTLSVNGEILSFENFARLLVFNDAEWPTIPGPVFDAFTMDVPTGGFTFAGVAWKRGFARSFLATNQFTSTNPPGALSPAVPISVGSLDSVFQLDDSNGLTGSIAVTGLIDQVSIVAGDASPVLSQVPLPAGGLLLLSGFAGFVSLKRRKSCTNT